VNRSQILIHKEHATMMRLLERSFIAAAGLSIAANAAVAAPEHERLRGTVSAISASGLTVHTATGNVSMSLSVATKDVGDKLVALDVLIFPPPMKGAAEGHFPWDKLPDTTLAGGEPDRIDAVEFLVRAGSHQHLQSRDDARTPGLRRFERDQALFELFFVDHGTTPRQKTSKRDRRSNRLTSVVRSRYR
jgi:hypothetical protein